MPLSPLECGTVGEGVPHGISHFGSERGRVRAPHKARRTGAPRQIRLITDY